MGKNDLWFREQVDKESDHKVTQMLELVCRIIETLLHPVTSISFMAIFVLYLSIYLSIYMIMLKDLMKG